MQKHFSTFVVGEHCSVSGRGDLGMDRSNYEFIRKDCVFIKMTKAGLAQVALTSNLTKVKSFSPSNIEWPEPQV